jgi:transposase
MKRERDIAKRATALALTELSGYSVTAAAERSGLSKATVSRVRQRARERGWKPGQPIKEEILKDMPRSGRHKILSDQDKRQLRRSVQENRSLSWKRMYNEVKSVNPEFPGCQRTFQNGAYELGFNR